MAQRHVRIEGIRPAKINVQRLQAGMGPRVREGLEAGAEVARDASIRFTPVEDGGLRAGYRISGITGAKTARVALANVEPYAAYVHEQTAEKLRGQPRPGSRRGNYWDGGESKFMEKAVFQNVDDILDAIRRASRFERVG